MHVSRKRKGSFSKSLKTFAGNSSEWDTCNIPRCTWSCGSASWLHVLYIQCRSAHYMYNYMPICSLSLSRSFMIARPLPGRSRHFSSRQRTYLHRWRSPSLKNSSSSHNATPTSSRNHNCSLWYSLCTQRAKLHCCWCSVFHDKITVTSWIPESHVKIQPQVYMYIYIWSSHVYSTPQHLNNNNSWCDILWKWTWNERCLF